MSNGHTSPYNVLADVEVVLPDAMHRLVNWYADYAKEVVVDRAIVNIDGFKPVHRRIMYMMWKLKVKELMKSAKFVGQVLGLHPHGDASVYESMVRMADRSEYMNIPYVKGKGSYGKVYSTEPPAAMRYTECAMTPNADMLFQGMDGIRMVPTEDGDDEEPELLPVSFPNILCNPNSGIAVGMASNIPSFNFHEVLAATIELIETGKIINPLAPDFTTGGYYVNNPSELEKIMTKGRGRLKLRGKWTIENKTIVIHEIPYYTTSTAIINQINKKQISGISDSRDESDKGGFRLAIECSSRKNVPYVLQELLKNTDLQMSMTTNLTVIIDNKPRVLGITELLQEWVNFRSNVLKKSLKVELDYVTVSIPRYEILVDLMSDDVKRETLMQTQVRKNTAASKDYLRSIYPGTPEDTFTWILGMSLTALSGVASKINKLNQLRQRKHELEQDMENINVTIVRELKELQATKSFPRKTEVTTEDYEFEKEDKVAVKAPATPTLVQINDKFVKKLRLTPATQDLDGIRCMSDGVLSFIDDQGRLLRVNLEHLDFISPNERGIFLPTYLNVEDDFEVIAFDLVEDKKVGYVYSDGFVSVLDLSEWVDSKRTTRITANGVSPLSGLIVGEIDFSKTHLMLMTNTRKFAFVGTDFKQKNRTARTKLIPVKEGEHINFVLALNYTDIIKLVNDPMKYFDKFSLLAHGDTFNSDYFELINK